MFQSPVKFLVIETLQDVEEYNKKYDFFKENYDFFVNDVIKSGLIWAMYFNTLNNDSISECSIRKEGNNWRIDDVLVDEKYRGQGQCFKLISKVIAYFKEKKSGQGDLLISCHLKNVPACKCYIKTFGDPHQSDSEKSHFKLNI